MVLAFTLGCLRQITKTKLQIMKTDGKDHMMMTVCTMWIQFIYVQICKTWLLTTYKVLKRKLLIPVTMKTRFDTT